MKDEIEIEDIKLATGFYHVVFKSTLRPYSDQVSIPVEEWSTENLWKAITAQVKKMTPNLEALDNIIKEWKGKTRVVET